MTMLRLLGYSVVSLDEAAAGLRATSPAGAPAGADLRRRLRGFLDNAAPVLQAHGYPATVYAVSGLIGATSSWDAGVGPEPAP